VDSKGFTAETVRFVTKIDSKGRVVIPADVRKTLGMDLGDELQLDVSVSGNFLIVRRWNK